MGCRESGFVSTSIDFVLLTRRGSLSFHLTSTAGSIALSETLSLCFSRWCSQTPRWLLMALKSCGVELVFIDNFGLKQQKLYQICTQHTVALFCFLCREGALCNRVPGELRMGHLGLKGRAGFHSGKKTQRMMQQTAEAHCLTRVNSAGQCVTFQVKLKPP